MFCHAFGLQVHGFWIRLLWNILDHITAILSASMGLNVVLFTLLKCVNQSCSPSVMHNGFRYGNSLFNFCWRSEHPQSSPPINFTRASIPVAFVTFCIVSPSPNDGRDSVNCFLVSLFFCIYFVFCLCSLFNVLFGVFY
jgi:hypothetical protein